MALYYLNTSGTTTTFYTDTGNMRSVMLFAQSSEYIRVSQFTGHHEITNQLMVIYKGRVSQQLSCLTRFLPANIHLKQLSDVRVIPKEFCVEFDSGIKAIMRHPGDLIVTLNNCQDRLTDLLECFRVPIRVCPALLTHPGTMYNVTLRSGSFFEHGYFKSIDEWLNLPLYEKPTKRLRIKPEKN